MRKEKREKPECSKETVGTVGKRMLVRDGKINKG